MSEDVAPPASRAPLAFVSYRRSDSLPYARWLGETISTLFGPASVFIDVDTEAIRAGDLWPDRIRSALGSATAVLAVIGPTWLRTSDSSGRRRLDNPEDWIRQEIEHALRANVLLIPLLVGGADLPSPDALPESIAPLLNHQTFELRDANWVDDRGLLMSRLEQAGFERLGNSPVFPDRNAEALRSSVRDEQLKVLKHAIELAYRTRNLARNLIDEFHATRGDTATDPQRLVAANANFEEILFAERAILSPDIFQAAHSFKRTLGVMRIVLLMNQKNTSPREPPRKTRPPPDLDRAFAALDASYAVFVSTVQAFLGIK